MTERQFIKLVKEMRRVQTDYERTGNMTLRSVMKRQELQVDAAIVQFDIQWEREQPKQQEFPNLFNVQPPKNE